MKQFLLWIGLYNALGPLLLMAMHSERVADGVMRAGTELIAEPYEHGKFGRLWLWWAATSNLALGAIMLLAMRWPPAMQQEVIVVVIGVYVAMWAVAIVGARKPRYGRGIWVLHGLWAGQIAWATYAVVS